MKGKLCLSYKNFEWSILEPVPQERRRKKKKKKKKNLMKQLMADAGAGGGFQHGVDDAMVCSKAASAWGRRRRASAGENVVQWIGVGDSDRVHPQVEH
ncbi:hypothetical protein B296_00007902 [Ensete ventricosum]|uniref:Uncharacterized protein n=1 Tax=Ensete ventricosum TaxID=4639 RepID=A0A426ZRJ2_ENSVE|nr:hypothetical protein B296_00007902 [Ensete ventricosum]